MPDDVADDRHGRAVGRAGDEVEVAGDAVVGRHERRRHVEPGGAREGVRGQRRPRPASGWEALTPTELKIAALVARGDSTPDIARGMFLSRRTVQKYISHILAKLGVKGRADIVRETMRRGISP